MREVGWLTALLAAAVAAVNVAGVWNIAVARRAVVEQRQGWVQLEAAARARSCEGQLADLRADLAFLARAPALLEFSAAAFAVDPAESRRRRDLAGAALLLFLRGQPAVVHMSVESLAATPLLEAGRPRGVPGFWLPAPPGGPTDAPLREDRDAQRIRSSFDIVRGDGAPAARLHVALDPAVLLAAGLGGGLPRADCTLVDGAGQPLAVDPSTPAAPPGAGERVGSHLLRADAAFRAEAWRPPGPWKIDCTERPEPTESGLEPLAAGYRQTMVLNLAVMALALALGLLGIREARRRQTLEDRAREAARVRELERQLFHAERLSTVGRLAAGMAHEINNPLEGIANYLRLGREALERNDLTAARRHLDGVQEGLRLAAGIVRRVLDHGERDSAPREPMDLNETLAQSVEFVSSRDEFRGIRFELDLDRRGAPVQGSRVMLSQVFLNLLLNACEAQPGGGEVRVSSRREGAWVLAEVADRGPGVAPAERQRIFEPFHSSKASTGLGLSVCHAIARQHQGELMVTEREGGGAIFALRLAALEAQARGA